MKFFGKVCKIGGGGMGVSEKRGITSLRKQGDIHQEGAEDQSRVKKGG